MRVVEFDESMVTLSEDVLRCVISICDNITHILCENGFSGFRLHVRFDEDVIITVKYMDVLSEGEILLTWQVSLNELVEELTRGKNLPKVVVNVEAEDLW